MMLIDDYLAYLEKYKLKYGDNTVVFMQVGMFFELYDINADSNYLNNIADICNIQISRKNKNIIEVSKNNPLMAGFPLYVLNKYTQLILDNNYTIILIEQVSEPPNPERKITEILSPSTNINQYNKKSNYVVVLYYEVINNNLVAGISGIDLSTGVNFIYEAGSTNEDPCFALDESFRLLSIYNPSELLILSDNINDTYKEQILNIININCLVHKKWDKCEFLEMIKKIKYQNELLQKSYVNHKTMLHIIEYLNLENLNIGRIAFCAAIQFAYEHNSDIIKDLNIPIIVENNKNLNIEFNSALQLNIISLNNNEKPLIDILNRCSTAFGSRKFKEQILNPIININDLNNKYDNIDYLLKDCKFKKVSKYLSNIIDFERIKRKMCVNKINPCEWCNFNTSLEYAINAIELLGKDDNNIIKLIREVIGDYINIIELNECTKYNLADIKTNIFKKGVYDNIDSINDKYISANNELIKIVEHISNIDDSLCKIDFNEREGYYISITKKRYENAYKKSKDYMIKFEKKLLSSSSTSYKLTSKEINNLSDIIEKCQEDISKMVLIKYKEFVSSFITNNNSKLITIINYLSDLDIYCCNAKNAFEYRYYRPVIDNINNNSYINAKDLRHTIIERINDNIEYIGNDIELNNSGILLYGINSSGKSSFMKAVGLNLIMAQSGMFVPSSSFIYYPYNHIMTRISGNDNIYKSMSSFVVEMTELRNILQRADKNSLIIGDEICNGTEAISGICIVSCAINELIKKNASFIFTSHLHELPNISIIKNEINNKLKIYHMHITIRDNKIIYDRKLREGQGSSIYGIEVCKSLDMPLDFMNNAEIIRKELNNTESCLINTKKNKYNSSLYNSTNICPVCKIEPIEDIHHINYQSLTDENGFFDNYHKNIKHNLVQICKKCHDNEHNNLISIEGYVQTSEGIELEVKELLTDFEKIRNYVRRGKKNWFLRKLKNATFKIATEEKVIETINKLTKKKIKELDDEYYNKLYDFSLY